MKLFIIKSNDWFDNLNEYYRLFLIFIVITSISYFAVIHPNNIISLSIYYIILNILIAWRILGLYFRK